MSKNNAFSKNVIVLGLVSFFNDLASEMVYPIVPIFLTSILGAPITLVGLIEGIVESTASLLKVFSGWLSDNMQKRKIFTLYGYSLSAISKFIIGMAMSWPIVLLGRFIDRFGKGIRTSARDALITESTTKEYVGRAFGLHRALDSAGAVFGPLAAILLIKYLGSDNLRSIFYVALIPGMIGVILLLIFVKEKAVHSNKKLPQFKIASLSPAYKRFLLVSAIFALGNSSDAFLILRAQSLGLSTTSTVLAYAVFNVVYSVLSYFAGSLSDKVGARKLLIFGFFLFSIIYFLFGVNNSDIWIWFLFALYGVYMAISEGISKAYITQTASSDLIATSLGAYQTIIGVCNLFSSIIAGFLWTNVNPSAPFIFGSFLSILAGIIFTIYSRKIR